MPHTWGAVEEALVRMGYHLAAEDGQQAVYMSQGSPFLYMELDRTGSPNIADICAQLREQGDNPDVFAAELESL